MIKQLEKQIRDLQRELAEVQKGQSALRLQPCRGDSEIREKDGKLENWIGGQKPQVKPSATWKENDRN